MKNYFIRDGKYFIVYNEIEIEVYERDYLMFVSFEEKIKYSNVKYNYWNRGYDDDRLIATKYEYIHHSRAINFEDCFVMHDEIERMLKKICPIDRHILEKRLAGYNDTEIAKELGITPQAVYKRNKKIKKTFSECLDFHSLGGNSHKH